MGRLSAVPAVLVASWLVAFQAAALERDPTGVWLTEDGKAAVAVQACGPALCGRLVWIDERRPPPGAPPGPPVDAFNPDPTLRDRPLCGLEMLAGFEPQEPELWTGGTVYNPEDGRTYRARLRLVGPDVLELRGYVLIPLLGRTQIWTRAGADFHWRCSEAR